MDKIITDLKILRQISRETTQEEVDKLDLLNRLKAANRNAWTKGCGLAAIQIGIPLRYAWFTWQGKDFELLNPEIVLKMGELTKHEGCLSIPDKWTEIRRAWEIEYFTHGKRKKAKGFKAQIIQHEVDHMDGILNLDKIIC